MDNPDLSPLHTDFIEACEKFLYYHTQTHQLLATIKSSTGHDGALLYEEAVQAHIWAKEACNRMRVIQEQLAQRWQETTLKDG